VELAVYRHFRARFSVPQTNLVASGIRLNRQLTEVNSQLHERIERLEGLLASQVDSKSSKTPVFTEY
jgi:hypothetical protein